jgi:hypothetical protein
MKSFIEKNDGIFQRIDSENAFLTTAYCPNNELHTTGISHSKEFSLKYYFKTHILIGSCFHNSCREANIKLLEKLFDELFENKILNNVTVKDKV